MEVDITVNEAQTLLSNYVTASNFSGPSEIANVTTNVTFHGLSLDGYNNQSIIKVMNTDDCFRHFLLNTTNEDQLSDFLAQTADHILLQFPAGLSTPVGMLVANPAYGGDPVYV